MLKIYVVNVRFHEKNERQAHGISKHKIISRGPIQLACTVLGWKFQNAWQATIWINCCPIALLDSCWEIIVKIILLIIAVPHSGFNCSLVGRIITNKKFPPVEWRFRQTKAASLVGRPNIPLWVSSSLDKEQLLWKCCSKAAVRRALPSCKNRAVDLL